MGVLDDAIREHLELKRQHGATDDEIARAETEALGPARRPAPPVDGDEATRADDEPALEPGETLIIPPVDDVAPPPGLEPRTPRAAPVHDIDEELTPPPPMSGPAPAGSEGDDDPIDDEKPGEEPGGQGHL